MITIFIKLKCDDLHIEQLVLELCPDAENIQKIQIL